MLFSLRLRMVVSVSLFCAPSPGYVALPTLAQVVDDAMVNTFLRTLVLLIRDGHLIPGRP